MFYMVTRRSASGNGSPLNITACKIVKTAVLAPMQRLAGEQGEALAVAPAVRREFLTFVSGLKRRRQVTIMPVITLLNR